MHVKAPAAAEEDGAADMEVLRDNEEGVESEDCLGADDGVEGAETRVVAHDAVLGNAGRDERALHVGRLVIAFDVVVAADDQRLHAPRLPKFRRSSDASLEKEVAAPVAEPFRAAQHYGGAALGRLALVPDGRHSFCGGDEYGRVARGDE